MITTTNELSVNSIRNQIMFNKKKSYIQNMYPNNKTKISATGDGQVTGID